MLLARTYIEENRLTYPTAQTNLTEVSVSVLVFLLIAKLCLAHATRRVPNAEVTLNDIRRYILLDWISEGLDISFSLHHSLVADLKKYENRTVYATAMLIDSHLMVVHCFLALPDVQQNNVPRPQLQLLGVAALVLASRFSINLMQKRFHGAGTLRKMS